jgi:uncharacterized protein YjeT (DUF2065 family)
VTELLAALRLALALVGTRNSHAPTALKRAMQAMQDLPDQTLRVGGLAALFVGVMIVWLARG